MRHKFEGIGEAGAAMVLAGLKANPSTTGLANGFVGKAIFFIVKVILMYFASLGLIVLNVGAAKLEAVVDKNDFNGAWDDADKIIAKFRETGRTMTEAEALAIDIPVIVAFRKFGSFARGKK